jgi:hypothetical protein
MKKILTLSAALIFFSQLSQGQGCIVVRNVAGYGQYNLKDRSFTTSDWQIGINNRYFKAYRTFVGHKEVDTLQNTNIIKSYSLDITATRFLANGWSITLDLPIGYNSRSTNGEHSGAGQPFHTTSAFGLGDIRVTVYKWLLNPSPTQKINIQLGLGLKLPTGDYQAQDYFYRNHDSTQILAPVSAPVQLGDGGLGIITELNTFYIINKTFSVYGNFFYMFNPKNVNGVSTLEGRTPSQAQILAKWTVNSVPDQFSLRAGLNALLGNWLLSAGLRSDGVPIHDVIGRSDGLRRSGHNVEVEPGIMYNFKKISVYLYTPFLIYHNVSVDVADKNLGASAVPGGSGDVMFFFGALFNL